MSSQAEQISSRIGDEAPVAADEQPKASSNARLFFVDNIRVLLTILVIMHHLAVTYGASGAWYYQDPTRDLITTIILTILVATNQAFFMGLFFLISAYFTPGSYDRKGAPIFLWERLLRLGIPLLIYDLVIDPLVVYIYSAHGLHESYWSFYGGFLLNLRVIGDGPVWFIEALLYFSVLYAAWRWLTRKRISALSTEGSLPTYRSMIIFILALTVVTFVVRLWLPVGSDFQPLNFQFSNFAQYISMFVIGLIAYRRNWLLRIPDAMGKVWLRVAIVAILLFPVIAIAGGAVDHSQVFEGGLSWQAFVYALWESIVCVGLCVGLLVLFRRRLNRQGKLGKALSASAYTAYIIHPLVIVPLAYAARDIQLYPLLKYGIAVTIAVPLCFLISYYIRKLPFTHKIL